MVAASPSKLRYLTLSVPIIFEISLVSFVVPGSGVQPGVFGWLTTSRLVGESSKFSVSEDLLSFSSSELTVGVYEDTARSEMHDPSAGRSFGS